ncbi:MAG: anthranilate synthase component II [Thermodesulfobacteriota bacterium]
MILLIDNYDSFTYNLVQYFGELGASCLVYRNDQIDTSSLLKINCQYLVISPGPGRPKDAGISPVAIKIFAGKVPILGVCLGHQCLGEIYGGKIIGAQKLMHGKSSLVYHDGKTIYQGVSNPFSAIRYHSLVIERKTLPSCLEISAQTAEGEIMGVRHKEFFMEGVQFHPESIMTQEGKKILKNFLDLGRTGPCLKNLLPK